MTTDGEDLDQYETAYEALAERKTIRIELGNNNTITLNMGNKEDKAKRDMLTQEENEVQDNIKVIMENRNQVKIICYNGFVVFRIPSVPPVGDWGRLGRASSWPQIRRWDRRRCTRVGRVVCA